MSISCGHVQDGVAALVAYVLERLRAKLVYKLLNVLEVAVATRKENIFSFFGRRSCKRHCSVESTRILVLWCVLERMAGVCSKFRVDRKRSSRRKVPGADRIFLFWDSLASH